MLDKALAASGRDSLFIKMHPDESVRPPFELLWLDDSVELEAAVEMAKADHVFGVVAKNTSKAPRLALRFAATSKLQEYAKRHGIFDYSRYGRWKLVLLAQPRFSNSEDGRSKKSSTSGISIASLLPTALVSQGPCSMSLSAHIGNSCCSQPSTPLPKNSSSKQLSKPEPPHHHSRTPPVSAPPSGNCRQPRRCKLPHPPLRAVRATLSALTPDLPATHPTHTSSVTAEGCVRFTARYVNYRAVSMVVTTRSRPLVSRAPVSAAWHMRRRDRNKRMHALVGNTGPCKDSSPLVVAALNVGGFHNSSKWMALRSHAADLFVLSETQLQRHLHSTINIEFAKFHTPLSPGQDDKHFTGVAVLARRSRFWAARTIQWAPDHPCYRFWADNRLLCTQLWCGAGDASIFCYAVYCPSGARWEASKKSYAHALLQAVRDDLIQQGDVAAILAGDFNLQVEDSFLLRQWRFDGPFYDVSTKAPPDIRDQPTCHHGTKGSKIDFVWVSRIAYDLVGTYSVSKLPLFKSHSVLRVSVHVPSSSQVRRTQRRVASLGCFMFAPLAPLGAGLEKNCMFSSMFGCTGKLFYETQWKMSTEKMQGKRIQEPNAANVCHVPHGDKFMSLCYLHILWKQACMRVGAGDCFLRLI